MALRAPRLLLGCHVYASEGRDAAVIARLRDLCRAQPGVLLAASFVDEPYHRSSYTLVSPSAPALESAVVTVAEAALAAIDLRGHSATHPRLGALDHISCHPVPASLGRGPVGGSSSSGDAGGSSSRGEVGGSSRGAGPDARAASGAHASTSSGGGAAGSSQLAAAAQLARGIGLRLAGGGAGLPVYFYGAAHPEGRRLAEIRRQLGYFGSTDAGSNSWRGALAAGADLSLYPPDAGPLAADPRRGVITVGAVPWIVNFNVPIRTDDVAAARRVARAVGERGGGLAGVEAMALAHSPGVVEVACNLLDPGTSPPQAVISAIEAAAAREGLRPVEGGAYVIGKLPDEIIAAADAQLL